MRKILILIIIFIVIALWVRGGNSKSDVGSNVEQENSIGSTSSLGNVITKNLYVPWSFVFLPNGDLLVTERNGNLKVLGVNSFETIIYGVVESGEGGLLGVALHPDFDQNNFLYLYFTTRDGDQIKNKVVRYFFDGSSLRDETLIVGDIPGGRNHNGGRIEFGPPTSCESRQADCMLYITTGDAGTSSLSQDINSLAGKILRVDESGGIPEDNPFGSKIYSYGHRNPQGLTWDNFGSLWVTEHGRSGLQSGLDEINLIKKGANYGWPTIQGSERRDGMETPVLHSGSDTWAPSGIVFLNGKLYFAGLRGQALYEVEILSSGELGLPKELFKNEYGRLRGLAVDNDGNIYVSTSNRDGRGRVLPEDDKIIKISL